MRSEHFWCALIFRLRTCEGRSVDRFSLTKKVICDQAFLPAKSQHLVAGYQGNKGQSTHHRLDRLQIVSVGNLRDQSTTQFHSWRSTNNPIGFGATLVACEVIARMLLGRIFRGHTCGGPPYLDMRAPEWHSCENLAGYRQFFRGHRNSRREYSGLASLTFRRFSLSSC